jgi:hypothetical protein
MPSAGLPTLALGMASMFTPTQQQLMVSYLTGGWSGVLEVHAHLLHSLAQLSQLRRFWLVVEFETVCLALPRGLTGPWRACHVVVSSM